MGFWSGGFLLPREDRSSRGRLGSSPHGQAIGSRGPCSPIPTLSLESRLVLLAAGKCPSAWGPVACDWSAAPEPPHQEPPAYTHSWVTK